MQLDWLGKILYALPPFSLIKRILKKVQKDQEETLIIASTEPEFVSRIAMVIKTFTISYFMER